MSELVGERERERENEPVNVGGTEVVTIDCLLN